MRDVNRDSIVEHALGRLVDQSFREKLTAVLPDGSRPIVPALLSDPLIDVLRQVHSGGGAGNVLVPVAPNGKGYCVIAMRVRSVADSESAGRDVLSSEITMGVLIARALQDGSDNGEMSYFVPGGCDDDGAEVAETEFVGCAD
jgi:hypothetical protein